MTQKIKTECQHKDYQISNFKGQDFAFCNDCKVLFDLTPTNQEDQGKECKHEDFTKTPGKDAWTCDSCKIIMTEREIRTLRESPSSNTLQGDSWAEWIDVGINSFLTVGGSEEYISDEDVPLLKTHLTKSFLQEKARVVDLGIKEIEKLDLRQTYGEKDIKEQVIKILKSI